MAHLQEQYHALTCLGLSTRRTRRSVTPCRRRVAGQDFTTAPPNSAGFIAPSRAVVSSDGQHALIYVGHFADGLAGRGFLHVLVREGGTLRVQKSVPIWVS